jgi:sec-independent protein translocase protein TatC
MSDLEQHMGELRRRLVYSVLSVALFSGTAFYFSRPAIKFLKQDLSVQFHAMQPFEVFYTQLRLSIFLGLAVATPVILYHALRFAAPGLEKDEYRAARNFLPFSTVLFGAGAVFSYQYVVKTSLNFFQSFSAQASVELVWGLSSVVGYAVRISAYTGLFFQVPIAASILAKAGLLTSANMKKYRNYFIVAVLVTAAAATPPDIITQLLITGPVILLYQLSIYMVERINS